MYKEKHGWYISDLVFLGWLKANDPKVYKFKKDLLERYNSGEMDDETYSKMLITYLENCGYKLTTERHPIVPFRKTGGCAPCTPGRRPLCISKVGLIADAPLDK